MGSNGFSVNPTALLVCAQTIMQEAAQFGGIADTLSSGPAYGVGTGTDFGTLPASGRLAGLTAQVNDAAKSEFNAAETYLRGTEYALDAALQTYMQADGANAAAVDAEAGELRHIEQMGTMP
jgi:hypothetical protein